MIRAPGEREKRGKCGQRTVSPSSHLLVLRKCGGIVHGHASYFCPKAPASIAAGVGGGVGWGGIYPFRIGYPLPIQKIFLCACILQHICVKKVMVLEPQRERERDVGMWART